MERQTRNTMFTTFFFNHSKSQQYQAHPHFRSDKMVLLPPSHTLVHLPIICCLSISTMHSLSLPITSRLVCFVKSFILSCSLSLLSPVQSHSLTHYVQYCLSHAIFFFSSLSLTQSSLICLSYAISI